MVGRQEVNRSATDRMTRCPAALMWSTYLAFFFSIMRWDYIFSSFPCWPPSKHPCVSDTLWCFTSKWGQRFAGKRTDSDHMTPARGSALLHWGHTAEETSSLTEHGRKHRMLCALWCACVHVCVCVWCHLLLEKQSKQEITKWTPKTQLMDKMEKKQSKNSPWWWYLRALVVAT